MDLLISFWLVVLLRMWDSIRNDFSFRHYEYITSLLGMFFDRNSHSWCLLPVHLPYVVNINIIYICDSSGVMWHNFLFLNKKIKIILPSDFHGKTFRLPVPRILPCIIQRMFSLNLLSLCKTRQSEKIFSVPIVFMLTS